MFTTDLNILHSAREYTMIIIRDYTCERNRAKLFGSRFQIFEILLMQECRIA